MTQENLNKITRSRSPFCVSDISVEEKKALAAALEKKGFTFPTFYLRFFQKGFDEWEILGVENCKKQFIELPEVAQALLEHQEEDCTDGDKGYYYVLAMSGEPGVFYRALKDTGRGLCSKFLGYMEERGMSRGTVRKRFYKDDWKEWEKEGVRAALTPFVK